MTEVTAKRAAHVALALTKVFSALRATPSTNSYVVPPAKELASVSVKGASNG